MSNVKVIAIQDGQPAEQTNTTHYIEPHVTQMDQKHTARKSLKQTKKLILI